MPSTLTGKYGFNGEVSILGTLTTPTIMLNGQDLTERISNIQLGQSTLQTDLTTGAVIPLNSVNSVTAEKSNKVIAVASNLQTTNHYIPFISETAGEAVCNTASDALSFLPSTKTMTVQNLAISGSISSCPLINAHQIKVASINISPENGVINLLKEGVNNRGRITLSDSTDLENSLANRVKLDGNQSVDGNKTFSGATICSGEFTASANSQLGTSNANTLTVKAKPTFESDAVFSGETQCNGAFVANGNSTLGSDSTDTLTVKAKPTFESDAVFGAKVDVSKLVSSDIQLSSPSDISYVVNATLTYLPSQYRNILCSTDTTTLCDINGESQTLNQYNFINTTYTTTTAVLNLPSPSLSLVGCEFTLIHYGLQQALALSIPTGTGSFNISNDPFSSDYVLPVFWYKVAFVCLPNPAVADSYFWLQTFYQ